MNLSFLRRIDAPVSVRPLRAASNSPVSFPITRSRVAILVALFCTSVSAHAQEAKLTAVPTTTPIKQVHVIRPSSVLPDSSHLRAPFVHQSTVTKNLTAVNTGPGVVFTCDPNVAAATCTYLNTTVAGYYNSTFTNANANVYIQFGATGLGSSIQYLNFVSYDNYVAALSLNTKKSAIQTSALSALNSHDATPYGSGNVEVTVALGGMLGFTGLTGIETNEAACTPGASGCYNAIITVTNDPGITLFYDNLGGTEPAGAYDFYAVVSHELNEVLGTSSCVSTQGNNGLADACGSGVPSAVDLFRYSGPGDLVLDSTLSAVPGAYFSYDGGTTNGAKGKAGLPKFYNTLANGDDYADFLSSSPDCGTNQVIQDAEGCPGEDQGLTILTDGGGEINILNTVGYNLPATKTPQTITFAALPNVTYGVSAFMLKATASSGLPVAYTVSGPAAISGAVLTVKGAGTVTVTASQAGNGTFAAATPIKQSFTVAKATLTATANNLSKAQGSANPTLTYMISGFVNADPSSVVSGSAGLTTTATSTSPVGKYPITFATKALIATNYNFSYVSGTLTVTAASTHADLLLRINLSPTTVRQGDLLTYAFPVWNLGPNSAVHEVLNTQVPSGTTFDSILISGTPGLGTCTQPAHGAAGPVVCHENSSMASNTTWTIKLTVKITAPSGTVIKESATATEDTPDPNLANNTATVSTTVH